MFPVTGRLCTFWNRMSAPVSTMLMFPVRHCDRKAAGRAGNRQTNRPLRRDKAAGHRTTRRVRVAGLLVADAERVVDVDAEIVVGVVVVVVVDEVVVGTVVVVDVVVGVGRRTVGTNATGR